MKEVTATATLVCGCERSQTWSVNDDTDPQVITEQAEQFAVDQAAQYEVTWHYTEDDKQPCQLSA